MIGRSRGAAVELAVLLTLASAPAVDAQYTEPPPPAAYALEDVTLVPVEGTRRAGVTVVVRGPFLEAADTGAEVPADARLLEGEGLWVYPGMVDAWGWAEVDMPERPDREEVTEWAPSRLARGFTPHLRIADRLTATGATMADERRKGLVASGVFPTRGFAAGLGATLLHRPEAERPRELVVHPEVGLSLSFQGARDAYPSTLFGVVADLRQSFSDAQRLGRLEQAYEQSPEGLTLPPWDPDYQVLLRVAGDGLPAFFAASDAEDIRRVLGLARELGFSPIIVGGGEAWRLADALASADVPVLVSLDFPEPRFWEPDPDDPGEPSSGLEARAARERNRLVDLYSNAARLSEAGVVFALTSGRGQADLREGARRAMEYGLSEEAALAATTLTPARILGVGPAARLVPGWSANFVVTDGPLFDEDTRIIYTFVEGHLHEVERDDDVPDPEEPPAVDVSGEWILVIEGDEGRTEYEVSLEQEGDRITGLARAPGGPTIRIRRGVVSGNEIELTLMVESGPETGEARATATVEGDRMEGSGGGFLGDFDLTATRQPEEPR